MNSKKWNLLTAVIAAVGLFTNISIGSKTEGFQYWNDVSLSTDITKDWQVTIDQEERMCNGGGNLYYEHTDLGFMRKNVTPWLDLSFNFRKIYEKNSHDDFKPTNYPYIDAIYKTKLFGCDFSDKSRIAFQDKTDQKDTWQYRNKIALKFPVELTNWKLQPFIANEFFFDLDQQGFYKNWFMPGFTFPVGKNLKCELSWLWQERKAEHEWETVNALVTRFKFYF